MNFHAISFYARLFWRLRVPQAAAAPLVKLSVRSYGDLTNIITRFAAIWIPVRKRLCAGIQQETGLTNQAAFDVKRSWELSFGMREHQHNQPLLAIKARWVTSIGLKTV